MNYFILMIKNFPTTKIPTHILIQSFTLDRRMTKLVLTAVCFISFSLSSCGGDSPKKENDFLKVFEEKSSLIDKDSQTLPLAQRNENNDAGDTTTQVIHEAKTEQKTKISTDEVSPEGNISTQLNKEKESSETESPAPKNKTESKEEHTPIQVGPFISVSITDNNKTANKIISISSDKQGNLYFAEPQRVIQRSVDGTIKEIVTSSSFEIDTKEEMPRITHVSSLEPNEIWLGFENGAVAYRSKLEWKIAGGGPRFSNAPITNIHQGFGEPFLGGKGLYQWDREFSRFLTVGEAKDLDIKNIAKNNTSLLVSTSYNLFKIPFPEKSFTTHFEPFREDVPLASVETFKENIFLGTRQGVLMLSPQGYPMKRFAEEIHINKIFPLDDTKGLILSRSGSLHAYLGKKTFTINDPLTHAIEDAHLDHQDSLWISQKVPFIFKGNFIEIYKWIVQTARKENKNTPFHKNYVNACDAAEALLGNSNYSGDLSRTKIDGKTHVFLKGNLVCPNGIGTIRPDGLSIVLSGWNLSIHKRNSRELVKLPENIPADLALKIFLDSKNRIFIATKKGLYYQNEKGSWESPEKKELNEDHISDIKEDSKGNIWISSRIQNTSTEQETPKEYQPLHILTAQGWAHFGTNEGLDSFGISEIEVDEEEILLATSQGFARISPDSKVSIQGPREGFTRSIIESITKDHYNRIWMTHGYFLSGISWIRGSDLYLTTKEKGLFSDRISSIGLDSHDRIWVLDTAGRTGVYSYQELLKIAEKRPYQKNRIKQGTLLK